MKRYSIFLVFTFLFPFNVFADTRLPSQIVENITLTVSESPYVFPNQGYVAPNALLTIEPGVEVLFEGRAIIEGKIDATGTSDKRITFNSTNPALPFTLLLFNGQNEFNYTDFKNLDDVSMFGGLNIFENSRFTDMSGSLGFWDEGKGLFEKVDFRGGLDSYVQAFTGSDVTIASSTFGTINSPDNALIEGYEGSKITILDSSLFSEGSKVIAVYGGSFFADNIQVNGALDDSLLFYGTEDKASTIWLLNSNVTHSSGSAIWSYNSDLNIHQSTLSGNGTGLEMYHSTIGKVDFTENFVSGNGVGGIIHTSAPIDLRRNWWGEKSGPTESVRNPNGKGDTLFLYGSNTPFSPWLTAWPPGKETGSSVAFFPGIEGSRLYKKQILEDQLWEPNLTFSSDVEYLFMNKDGTSKNKGIYTKDVIDIVNSVPSTKKTKIYDNFISSMNTLKDVKDINDWKPFPYDWRYDYKDIINNGIQLQKQIEYIIPELEKMASSSATGKVTIITHSNGGLLAKAVIEKMQERGKQNLIDKLIMIAPPQLGAPDAINILLHGEEDPNIVLNKKVTRGLAENMKSAYNLLPSEKYMETVADPLITFTNNSADVSNFKKIYGESVDTYEELKDFLSAVKDKRKDPSYEDVQSPNVLTSSFVSNSESVHQDLDNWVPPENIEVYQIAGWGILTTSGIQYFKSPSCTTDSTGKCVFSLDHEVVKTIDGDKTVVTPSVAVIPSAKTLYFNFKDFLKENSVNLEHKNITEALPILNLVNNIITGSVDLPKYITAEKPTDPAYKNLKISMHSPVAIDAYDENGNHTGTVKDPNSDSYFIEENIPNSIYEEIGEAKYIYLDPDSKATIKLTGLDTGTFTMKVESQEGGETVDEQTFADLPTTSNTEGEIVVGQEEQNPLSLDIEGDGKTDIQINSGQELTPVEYLGFIRKTVEGLDINKKLKSDIIKRLNKIEKLISKSKDKQVIKKIKDFNKNIKMLSKVKFGKHHHKVISKTDADALVNMINQLLDLLE